MVRVSERAWPRERCALEHREPTLKVATCMVDERGRRMSEQVIVIDSLLKEVRKRRTNNDIKACIWKLENGPDEPVCRGVDWRHSCRGERLVGPGEEGESGTSAGTVNGIRGYHHV